MKRTMNLLIVSLFLVAGMTACYSSAYVATVPVSVSTPLPSNRVIVTTAQTTNSYPVNRPIAQNSDITITANSDEISANLDLRAIANIFAECSTLEEFEQKINDYNAQLSNLDLNQDGYVDYIRVVETAEGNARLVALQAVLGPDIYQDVATIMLEQSQNNTVVVQFIGDPYIYGPDYIITPVYVSVPVIYSYFWRPYYTVWHSPYYWGYYPTYYRRRPIVEVNVYHTHIYNCNRRYHNEFRYDAHYSSRYETMRKSVSRNDYAVRYPENSFSRRNTSVRNARTLELENTRRNAVQARSTSQSQPSRVSTSTRSSSTGTSTNRVSTTQRTSTPVTSRSSSTTQRTSTPTRTSAQSSSSRSTSSSTGVTSGATTVRRTTSATSSSTRTSTPKVQSGSSSGRSSSTVKRSSTSTAVKKAQTPASSVRKSSSTSSSSRAAKRSSSTTVKKAQTSTSSVRKGSSTSSSSKAAKRTSSSTSRSSSSRTSSSNSRR